VCVCHLNYSTCKSRCGLSGSTLFSTLSYKPHDFVKTNLLSVKVWFEFLYKLYEIYHFVNQIIIKFGSRFNRRFFDMPVHFCRKTTQREREGEN
jgi:hypothetical protein